MTVSVPVKVSAVYNRSAYLNGMSVHIFCGGVGYNVSAPLEWTAVYRCGKGVIHNKGNAVAVGYVCKFFNIKNNKSRVCNGFCKKNFCVRAESFCDFFFACICVHKGAVNTKFFEGNCKKVEGSAVNGGGGNYVIACFADIKDSVEVCRLSGRSKKSCNSAFQSCNFCSNCIICRILKACVEISFGF